MKQKAEVKVYVMIPESLIKIQLDVSEPILDSVISWYGQLIQIQKIFYFIKIYYNFVWNNKKSTISLNN